MDLPAATEVGDLGVLQLKRIWASHAASRQGTRPSAARRGEWRLDQVVLCGLNLALEETLQYLMREGPDFATFEQWVLQRNHGALDPGQVARINAAVGGGPAPPRRAGTAEAPVLDAADRAHWIEHGYVVVRRAISREQAAAAADALWRHRGMDPDDPATWYVSNRGGIMVQLFHHPALEANRRSPRIRRAFEEIWSLEGPDVPDLWVTTDRVSFNPPEREGWRFPGPPLHFDADLAERPVPFTTGGIIYLTDTPAHQGAFACVPGFHRRIEAWLDALPAGAEPSQEAARTLDAVPIAAEAGDLIIWHHALPHGPTPNAGTQPRIVHYVNMIPTPSR